MTPSRAPVPPIDAICPVSSSEDERGCVIVATPFSTPCMGLAGDRNFGSSTTGARECRWQQGGRSGGGPLRRLRYDMSIRDAFRDTAGTAGVGRIAAAHRAGAVKPVRRRRLSHPEENLRRTAGQCKRHVHCSELFEATATCELGGGSFTARPSDAATRSAAVTEVHRNPQPQENRQPRLSSGGGRRWRTPQLGKA